MQIFVQRPLFTTRTAVTHAWNDLDTCFYTRCARLSGLTDERKFYNITGSGLNGKSAQYTLLRKCLGPLYLVAHRALYIKGDDRHKGGPEPHKVALKCKRVSVLQETSPEDMLCITLMKCLVDSGEMPMSARDLFEKMQTFIVRAKHFILSNNDMRFDKAAGDKGGDDRLEVQSFLVRFISNPAELAEHVKLALSKGTKCYYKLADHDFVYRINTIYLNEVFSYYVTGAIDYFKNGRKIEKPTSVIQATKGMLTRNDIVQQFIDETCQIGENAAMPTTELYFHFQQWASANGKSLSRNDFSAMIQKDKGFDVKNAMFKGIKTRCYIGIEMRPLLNDMGPAP